MYCKVFYENFQYVGHALSRTKCEIINGVALIKC